LALVLATIVVSAAPFLLNLAGVDFSSRGPAIDVQELQNESSRSISTSVLVSSSGQFTHTILEWSAFCAALFTVILACSFYSIRKEPVMPVIGTSLFCVGIMDAFHTLAADHLISGVADQSDLIPFTWAICRVFNAGIIIAGTSIFLTRKSDSKKSGLSFVVTIPLLFGLVAYALIHLCATSARLRRTTRTSSSVRPERRFTVAKGAPERGPVLDEDRTLLDGSRDERVRGGTSSSRWRGTPPAIDGLRIERQAKPGPGGNEDLSVLDHGLLHGQIKPHGIALVTGENLDADAIRHAREQV